MSSTKGNLTRKRPQKHQNRSAFKNDLYDKSVKTKFLNSIQPSGICSRCKEIIEWKIKYKKYKTLTAPKTCVRCDQRTIKHAYHVMCLPCSKNERVCAKCCKSEEVIEVKLPTTPAEDEELKRVLKALPERKRRTLLRYLKKQEDGLKKDRKRDPNDDVADAETEEKSKVDLTEKINKLKLDAQKDNIEDYDSDFDDLNSDCEEDVNSESCDSVSDISHG